MKGRKRSRLIIFAIGLIRILLSIISGINIFFNSKNLKKGLRRAKLILRPTIHIPLKCQTEHTNLFYYGKGRNPEKVMKETSKGKLKVGFIGNEYFGKDDPQQLENNILQYELILHQNGNFSTKPSNADDAF